MDNRFKSPKVIQLHRKKEEENAQLLKQLSEMAQNGELNGFVFAGFNKDKDVITVALDVSAIEMQTLISYLQMRSVKNMIFGSDDDEGGYE